MQTENFYVVAIAFFLALTGIFLVQKFFHWLPLLKKRSRPLISGFGGFVLFFMLNILRIEIFDEFDLNRIERDYIGYLLGICSWAYFGYFLSKAVDFFVWNGIMRGTNGSEVSQLLRSGVDIIIFSLTSVLIIYFVFGKSANGLIATSSVLTIIIGISARTTLASLFAGISINLSKGLKKGDYVVVRGREEVRGRIADMDWRSVTIVNENENFEIVPNDYLANNIITNYSLPSLRRSVEIEVVQNYDISPFKIKNFLIDAALKSPHVLNLPVPEAFIKRFEEKKIIYAVKVYTYSTSDRAVINDVLSAVWYTLNRAGVQSFAEQQNIFGEKEPQNFVSRKQGFIKYTPSFDLERSESTRETELLIEKMREKDILKIFSKEELEFIISKSNRLLFGPPEQIVEQGDEGDSLFFILEGKAKVYIMHSETEQQIVGELREGDIFGEKAALFGEKRGATVEAVTEVKVYEVKRDLINLLIERNPKILDDLSLLFAKRSILNEEVTLQYLTDKQKENAVTEQKLKLKKLMMSIFAGEKT
jgi:small-conductance mechanosensitive channel/CRP-like cAMP-binding protein